MKHLQYWIHDVTWWKLNSLVLLVSTHFFSFLSLLNWNMFYFYCSMIFWVILCSYHIKLFRSCLDMENLVMVLAICFFFLFNYLFISRYMNLLKRIYFKFFKEVLFNEKTGLILWKSNLTSTWDSSMLGYCH